MSENWLVCYKLQYERIAQHESQRLIFSNMVLVVSCAIFSFGSRFDNELSIFSSCYLAILVSAINWVAIKHTSKSRFWVKFHQKRAKELLEKFDGELLLTLNKVKKPDSNKDPRRRPELLKMLHETLIILSIIFPVVVYFGHV